MSVGMLAAIWVLVPTHAILVPETQLREDERVAGKAWLFVSQNLSRVVLNFATRSSLQSNPFRTGSRVQHK